MINTKITTSIKKNRQQIKEIIGHSQDIEYREFKIPTFSNSRALLIYINNMVDNKEIDEFVLAPLMNHARRPNFSFFFSQKKIIQYLLNSGIFIRQAGEAHTFTELCDTITQGNACLIVDGCATAIMLATKSLSTRAITEPLTESEIRGPRDGFIENIATNTALIRARIKDFGLRFENLSLGERTKTAISLVYIQTIVNEGILEELRTRLGRIKVDSILASGYVEEFIEDEPFSIFPQIEHTERPDKASSAILEGRIVILVDNTPFALIVPTVFWNFFQTSGDYYDRYFLGTFLRVIRLMAMVCSITLSSLYVILASYHQEMLPTIIALKIAQWREGVPFPALFEALIMDILLEIIREASLRMPRQVGSTLGIVGTFIMGEAAILAGIASPILIIFITIAAICSYAIPSYSLGNTLRFIRFPILIISGCFGLLGFFACIILIITHLLSLRNFGEPFLAPIIPFSKEGNKDVLLRAPWWMMKKRTLNHPKDVNRQATQDLKPQPPKKRQHV